MTVKNKIVTAIATGALFVSTLAPMALADSSVTVSGNGAVSQNSVNTNQNTSTSLTQHNNADISNNVTSSSNTGGNSSSFNTGGSSAISTGNASNTTAILNQANTNIADVGAGTSGSGSGAVAVTGNGAFSTNDVTANSANNTTLNQNNNAYFSNTVNSKANTGNNNANFNTGGNTTVLTGSASNDTTIANRANANVATLPSGNGNSFGSAIIGGNGAASDNAVTLSNANNTTLNQNNWADIYNSVTSNSNTGNNSAKFNTGGSVLLATGNAGNSTNIDNMANFNAASLQSCGCATTDNGFVAILGNGAFSKNTVTSALNNQMRLAQNNWADITNNLRNNNKTGYNSTGWNTGGSSFLFSGGSMGSTDLRSSANVNDVSSGAGFNFGGMDIHLLFDMNSLLNQMHL